MSESGVSVTDTTTHRPITYTTYDNAEATKEQQYDGAGIAPLHARIDQRRARRTLLQLPPHQTTTSYDDRAVRTNRRFSVSIRVKPAGPPARSVRRSIQTPSTTIAAM